MNFNNGTPKYVIKSCLSPYQKSPLSEKRFNKKIRFPDSSIYANRKTKDLKLSFAHSIQTLTDKPTLTPIAAEKQIHDIKDLAASIIQQYMKSYFENHPYTTPEINSDIISEKEQDNTVSLL